MIQQSQTEPQHQPFNIIPISCTTCNRVLDLVQGRLLAHVEFIVRSNVWNNPSCLSIIHHPFFLTAVIIIIVTITCVLILLVLAAAPVPISPVSSTSVMLSNGLLMLVSGKKTFRSPEITDHLDPDQDVLVQRVFLLPGIEWKLVALCPRIFPVDDEQCILADHPCLAYLKGLADHASQCSDGHCKVWFLLLLVHDILLDG